jgi:hypothetical protein
MRNNVPSRLNSSLILILLVATAASIVKYSPTVRAQPQAPALCFEHSRGQFKGEGFGAWQEYYDGKATYSFSYKGDDSDYIYVFDKSRNLTLALPKKGGWTRVQWGDGPWNNGYLVQPSCSGSTPKNNILQTATTGVLTAAHAHGECRTDQCYRSGVTIVDAINYCATCVTLTAYMPLTAQVMNIRCLTTATTNGGADSPSVREVPCGALDGWATFDRPVQSTSPTNTIVTTVFHNRSHNRNRDVELQVDYK